MENSLITLLNEAIKKHPDLLGDGSVLGAIGEGHKGAELFAKYIVHKRKTNKIIAQPASGKYDFLDYLKEEGKQDPFAQKMATEIENMIKKGQFTDQVLATLERIFTGLKILEKENEINYRYDAALKEALRYSLPQTTGNTGGINLAVPQLSGPRSVPQGRVTSTAPGYRKRINPSEVSKSNTGLLDQNITRGSKAQNDSDENQTWQENTPEQAQSMASAASAESSGGKKILKRAGGITAGAVTSYGIFSFFSGGDAQGAVFGFIKHLF